MQTAAGSKGASPCWVEAKSMTRPPGRMASIAVWMRALPPTATRATSAPRPSVAAFRAATTSLPGVEWVVEAELRGDGVALGVEVAGEDGGTGTLGKGSEQDADGSLADDEDGLVGLEVEQLHGLVAGVDGLEEGGLLEWDVVRDANDAALDDPIHDADVLGEASAGGLAKPAVQPTFL